MPEEETSNRESVLGAIVLVLAHSKLKDVVGSEALKSVLAGQYPDLVAGGSLRLQVVWDLLSGQDNFDVESAKPPFCVLKTWEPDLHLPVEFPSQLAGLSATEIVVNSSQCHVPKAKKTRVLNPVGAQAKAVAQAEHERQTTGLHEVASSRKPMQEAALALVGVIGLGFGGYTLSGAIGDPEYQEVSAQMFQGVLPVTRAKRLGEEVTVTIDNEGWYQVGDSERKEALKAALDRLETSDVTSIIIVDKRGAIRGSAQMLNSNISVRLH